MFKVKSVTGVIHDLGYGGYPYKIQAVIEVDAEYYKKLKGDLGMLVMAVNNTLYTLNNNIPAHSPSIDPHGHKRAKNGVKTMIFEYFMQDHNRAERLGYKMHRFNKGTQVIPEYGQYVKIA